MKTFKIDIEGKTVKEVWEHLVCLVSSACESKQNSESHEFPTFISISGEGTIKVIEKP